MRQWNTIIKQYTALLPLMTNFEILLLMIAQLKFIGFRSLLLTLVLSIL